MFDKEAEERLDTLERKVEELSTQVETLQNEREEETLIPGAEYDFVPSYEPKVIAKGIAKIISVRRASAELGLSQREWEQFSPDEET